MHIDGHRVFRAALTALIRPKHPRSCSFIHSFIHWLSGPFLAHSLFPYHIHSFTHTCIQLLINLFAMYVVPTWWHKFRARAKRYRKEWNLVPAPKESRASLVRGNHVKVDRYNPRLSRYSYHQPEKRAISSSPPSALCFSHVWVFSTPWTVAHQASLSKGFPRQEYWSGLPFPPPGDLPHPGIELTSLMSLALASSAMWEASASYGSKELRAITR